MLEQAAVSLVMGKWNIVNAGDKHMQTPPD
jgi:hypothetical protein